MSETQADADPDAPVVHVFPGVGPDHNTEDEGSCWCVPELERQDGGGLVAIHRLMN